MWTLFLLAVTFLLLAASYFRRFGKPDNFPPGQCVCVCVCLGNKKCYGVFGERKQVITCLLNCRKCGIILLEFPVDPWVSNLKKKKTYQKIFLKNTLKRSYDGLMGIKTEKLLLVTSRGGL
jgi:hypothetical protein